MVAARGWDLLGAHHVGMRTAWISRGEGRLLDTLPAFDLAGADLLDVARAVTAAHQR